MRILALDIGKRRTGVAYLDTAVGISLPLMTLHHRQDKEMIQAIEALLLTRKIEKLVIGLPLLPSGDEGTQSGFVRKIGARLNVGSVPVEYRDERYTTPVKRKLKHAVDSREYDGDAASACALLDTELGAK